MDGKVHGKRTVRDGKVRGGKQLDGKVHGKRTVRAVVMWLVDLAPCWSGSAKKKSSKKAAVG